MKTKSASQGFTLIEVMVATAVLVIMVLMISGLFRQSTSAWDSGYTRAEGGIIVRSVIGAFERDLHTAVDGRQFGITKDPIDVSDSKVTMVCAGTSGKYNQVTYTFGSTVKRQEQVLNASGDNWKPSGGTESTLYSSGQEVSSSGYAAKFHVTALDVPSDSMIYDGEVFKRKGEAESGSSGDFVKKVKWNEVAGVKIRLTLSQTGTFSGLKVTSLGPDGKKGVNNGKNDDIIFQ